MDVEIREKAEQDWTIVHDAGSWLVGKIALDDDGGESFPLRLSPVFLLGMQVEPEIGPGGQQTGRVRVTDIVQPARFMASLTREWRLSPAANRWPVRGCSRESQIRSAIAKGEADVRQMRANEAGLTLATAMPRLGRVQ